MTETLHAIPPNGRTRETPASRPEHRIRDIMTTPVHSVDMDDSILTVKRLFERERCHHVVVLKHGRAHGVVSDRDILRVLSPFVGSKMMERSQDLNTLKKRVHQIMSRNLVTMTPEETITATAEKMLQERVSCLPVVDDGGSLVGIVTVRDFVKWSVDLADAKRTHAGGELDQDEGILVIIDGSRCYAPDAAMAQLIRNAENVYNLKHDADSARPKRLSMSPDSTDPHPEACE